MAEPKKKVVKTKMTNEKGKEVSVELSIVYPQPAQLNSAQLEYDKCFKSALAGDAFLRPETDRILRERGLWDDEKEADFIALRERIAALELELDEGDMFIDEAKDVAIDIRRARLDIADLVAEKNYLDGNTAEAQAEQSRFNYLVSVCSVYNKVWGDHKRGDRVFKTLNEYLTNNTEQYARDLATQFATIMYNVDSDFEKNLPENKFLAEYGFVRDDLRLVNEDGHLVDLQDRLVDEDFNLVNEKGEIIDEEGHLLDENGKRKDIKFKPFKTRDGKAVKPKVLTTKE